MKTGSLNFSAGSGRFQGLAIALGLAHAEQQAAFTGVIAALLLPQHHAGRAIEARQAADDAQVAGVPIAGEFDEQEYFVDIVQRVGTLGMAAILVICHGVRSE